MCNSYLIIHIAISCLILTSWSCRTLGCMPRCGIVYPKTVFVSHFVSSYNTLRSYFVCTLTDDALKVMRTSELFIPTNKLTVIYRFQRSRPTRGGTVRRHTIACKSRSTIILTVCCSSQRVFCLGSVRSGLN